ncbi:Stage II sporulation protein P (SpoIIP) [Lachnospiraceae bacterium XBB1006]|nr:Stage II sporulation protein P (SpoIIP) [Lachnospiraceae bacterium XBB1006]
MVKVIALGMLGMSFFGMLGLGGHRLLAGLMLHLEAPLITYETSGEKQSLGNLIEQVVLKQSPLYEYLSEKSYEQTSVESSFSYSLRMRGKEKRRKERIVATEMPRQPSKSFRKAVVKKYGRRRLASYAYLVKHFYHVDATTRLSPRLLRFSSLFSKDLRISPGKGKPRILIYHTHAHEEYRDTGQCKGKTVVDLGEELTTLLEKKYNMTVLHHKGVYDDNRNVAYSKALPNIERILKNNPSIEVVIDLHRDGIAPGTHLVTRWKGKKTAKIMFFNGVSYSKALGPITYLQNPHLKDNLAFSMQMQLAADTFYPGLSRGVYIKGYRYNMHLAGRNLLVEVGAQNNTYPEAKRAMEPLADLLHRILQ